jgi:creatinine amidohydrolase/Fe(II)-dependent formamide hydrolase-like protein
VLPVGAFEQHGPHLPLGTDTLIIEALLDRVAGNEALKKDFWLLPSIAYGCSMEHMGFPGTITLSPQTLCAVIEDILRSMKDHGWTRLVLLNGHGGNDGILRGMAQSWRYKYGVTIYELHIGSDLYNNCSGDLHTPPSIDVHAGENETDIMLASYPAMVNQEELEKKPDTIIESLPPYKDSWLTAEISPTGVIGGASRASAEAGEKLLQAIADTLIGALNAIGTF